MKFDVHIKNFRNPLVPKGNKWELYGNWIDSGWLVSKKLRGKKDIDLFQDSHLTRERLRDHHASLA